MFYKVSELEEELGVPTRTIRNWVDLGSPGERDDQGHLWINGRQFADWVSQISQARRKTKLGDDEAYCLKCRQVVKLANPVLQNGSGKQTLYSGTCPVCGGKINRGGSTHG